MPREIIRRDLSRQLGIPLELFDAVPVVAHELSHLFRIVTESTGPTIEEEETLADRDAETPRFDFGDRIREMFMETISPKERIPNPLYSEKDYEEEVEDHRQVNIRMIEMELEALKKKPDPVWRKIDVNLL